MTSDLMLINAAISNILMSMIKADDAPCSAETHLCQALDHLLDVSPEYSTSSPDMQTELEYAKETMRLLRGR